MPVLTDPPWSSQARLQADPLISPLFNAGLPERVEGGEERKCLRFEALEVLPVCCDKHSKEIFSVFSVFSLWVCACWTWLVGLGRSALRVPPRRRVCAHPECLRTGSFHKQAWYFLPSHGQSSVSSLRTLWRCLRGHFLCGEKGEGENESCAWFPGAGGAL